MKHLKMHELTEFLSGPSVQVYAYTKEFQQAQMEPFALFHTSGTTGFPKLVVITHGTMAACDAYQSAHIFGYAQTQVELFKGKRVFAGLPPYHAAGMFHFLAMPTFYGSIPVIAPPTAPTAALTSEMLEHGDVNVLILRPNVLSDITDEPSWLERLGSLDYVMSAACVLPKRVGDKIATKTSVTTYMGATETMLVPLELLDPQDWEYITPSEVMGAEFRHHNEDLYELFIVRHPDLKACQAIFFTFPDLQEYSMKDLYSRHPTEPRLWRYRGRVDDVIQLSNGLKILPAAMESAVATHPDVKTAVALGQAREKTALLIEVRDEPLLVDRARLLDSVTPSLEAANQAYPEYARVSKDRVLFATRAKPMVWTPKGTVKRVTMSKMYEEELDRVA